KDRVHDYVLSDFAKSEAGWVETLCRAAAENAELLVKGEDATFQNKVHLAMAAAGFNGKD
ncbi:MAG TPA: aminoacyl-tRNA hydrolase, partial [Methylovirgula sp.]|nr:aminoacyl-tRNA hydrolase [Methylovirgula sp.]